MIFRVEDDALGGGLFAALQQLVSIPPPELSQRRPADRP